MRVQCTCRKCGAAFTAKPSTIKRGSGIFCSRPCYQATKRQPVHRSCEHCGVSFLAHQFRIDAGEGRYCSHPCYVAATTLPIEVRFWPKVRKTDGCWEWTANHLPKGYGVIGRGGQGAGLALAHRVAYEMASGEPIPDKLDVLHTCDNPPCVRNDEIGVYILGGIARLRYGHLFLGTVKDNGIDMVEKGRDRQPWAKLTVETVRAIRVRFAAGDITKAALAAEYDVNEATIGDAISGRTWKRA